MTNDFTSTQMQIPDEQAVFLTLLVRLTNATGIVEVGTHAGCSTLALAQGMPPGGRLVTCDVSPEWTAIAEAAWRAAGVRDAIELRVGPAERTLGELPTDPWIDLVYLDADKANYETYWEQLVPRVRPGGVLLADNTLSCGEAADDSPAGDAAAIAAFNARVRRDPRVESVLFPVADGLTMAWKRPAA
jgi:caffeoyl-CoA O-methyltransferase